MNLGFFFNRATPQPTQEQVKHTLNYIKELSHIIYSFFVHTLNASYYSHEHLLDSSIVDLRSSSLICKKQMKSKHVHIIEHISEASVIQKRVYVRKHLSCSIC